MTDTNNIQVWWQRLQAVLPWIPVVGLLMVISAVPYGWSAYQRVGSYMLVIGFFVWWFADRQWRNWHWTPWNWMYVAMMALYLMFPVRQLFDATPPTGIYARIVHMHDWFLYTGIVGIMGFPDKLKLRHVAYVMLLTSVVMAAHCAYLYWGTDELLGMMPLERFNTLRWQHISSHMIMNLYLNTAILFGFCTLHQPVRWWQKLPVIIAMVVAWLLILLSAGRTGMMASLVIVGVGVLYPVFRKNTYWGIACTALIGLMAGLIIAHQPRMVKERIASDPRYAVWDYSLRIAKEKPVCGYGLSTLSEVYVEQAYQDSTMYNGFIVPVIEGISIFDEQGRTFETHHPHNAFLTYWLAVGIPGVLLLLALFAIAAYLPVGEYRPYLWLFLLALFMQCMTEPIGAHLMPQMIAIVLFVWEKKARAYRSTER